VTELIILWCTFPFPHEPQQIPRFDRCMQQTSEIQVWVSIVCGECPDDESWQDMPSNRNHAGRDVWRVWILIKFWLSCCALSFVCFPDFFLWHHVMIKILVGMFERRMSVSDRSQRFSDDRRGGG
jgi:hypothetical protein